MFRFIVRRILFLIPVMLGVLLIVFILTALTPGDPVSVMYQGTSEEFQAEKRAEMGLDAPLIVRYVKYVVGIVTRGDLGISYKSGQPIWNELMVRFPVTLMLALISVGIGVVVGIPLGVWAAAKQYTWVDSGILVISMISISFPSFWLALLLIMLFSVNLGWLPSGGITEPAGWIMPILVVAFSCMSSVVRITRSSMLEVIRQDFIRTAKSKGQTVDVVIWKHALRNALIPIITNIGGQIGIQLGGALIVEAIFGIPGIGQYMVNAINGQNYPAVQGGVVLLAFVYTIVNLLVDISYTLVDPRVKLQMIAKRPNKMKKLLLEAAKGGAVHG